VNTAEATIVVTLDIGGSAAKASGYDAARQVSLGTTAVPYPGAPAGQDPGMFDPDGWWAAAVAALRGIRELIGEQAGRYLGITVSAIRIPFVLVDGRGDAVMPGLLNRDRRAAPHVEQVTSAIGSDRLYRLTGHWAAPEFGLPKLLWVRESYPDAWRASDKVLQLHDWFICRLCGVLASERSSAAMSQLIDFSTGGWAGDLLATLGISASLLPDLRQAGALAGPLLPEVAAATGFTPGTPVHVGCGDTHMSVLSAVSADRGVAGPVIVAGTTAPVMLVEPGAQLPPDTSALFPLLLSEHAVAGMTALEANAGPTGSIADQLADLPGQPGDLAPELVARGVQLADGDGDDELVVLAGNPFFGPDGWSKVPPPTAIGLRDGHSSGDVKRACLRGTCYAIRSMLDCIAQRRGEHRWQVTATGGMSRSAEWSQLLADVAGRPVTVPALERVAGRGGALLVSGQHAVGENSPAAASQYPGSTATSAGADRQPAARRTYFPNPEAVAAHAAGAARYQRLYRAAQLDTRDRLVTGARTH
jgi:xylulokinase